MTVKVIKIANKGKEQFWELVRQGPPLFDSRPGWLLIGQPINARHRILQWMHISEVKVLWITDFDSTKDYINQ